MSTWAATSSLPTNTCPSSWARAPGWKLRCSLDTTTHGLNKGKNGSYSDNYQQTGRELLTPDEVRMLDNRYALLFIRGERPIVDEKYDLMKHPNIHDTPDGGGQPYRHDGLDDEPRPIAFDADRADDFILLDGDELTGMVTGQIDYFESPEEENIP